MHKQVEELLAVYDTLEELFESLDITPEEVLITLLNAGIVTLPPWLDNDTEYNDQEP